MYKYIVPVISNDKETHINVFLWPDEYNHSLEVFIKMANIAKADFPGLIDDQIECHTITNSIAHKGKPIIRFQLPADTKHLEYKVLDHLEEALL